MDIYFEQNISNADIDKHRKRTTVLSILRKVFLVVGILLVLILFGSISAPFNTIKVIVGLVISLLSGAPFVIAFFLMGRFLKKSNSEYDYILKDGTLKIARVTLRIKRKLAFTVKMDAISSIGRVTCDAYERLAASKTSKKQFAICNAETEEDIVYIAYRDEGNDYLLHIEPNQEMISSLRRSLPRIGIMDKSLNMPTSSANKNDIPR